MIEDFKNDYEWVINILESCTNQGQLDTTEKCYEQFKDKWSEFFKSKDSQMDKLTFEYDEKFEIILAHKRNTLGW
jgi:hypothetical protein